MLFNNWRFSLCSFHLLVLFISSSKVAAFSRGMRRSKLPLAATGWTVHSGQESSSLAGEPVSPILPAAQNHLLLRYIFEGGKLSRDARLTTLDLGQSSDGQIVVTAADVLTALSADGVDLGVFYATAYEAHESGGVGEAWFGTRKSCLLEFHARPAASFSGLSC